MGLANDVVAEDDQGPGAYRVILDGQEGEEYGMDIENQKSELPPLFLLLP
jgi:hypothetical protein